MVGLNLTQYSSAQDSELVSNLGPDNLNLTISADDPKLVTCDSANLSLFDDVTAALPGNLFFT